MKLLAVLTFLAAIPGVACAEHAAFEDASVHFEQNATDGDVEVVFKVKGGVEGLAKLTVVAPDGRTVVDFSAPDASTLGIRQFEFESPEPADVAALKAAYPEGTYVFTGATGSGTEFRGESSLSHGLPAVSAFVQPKGEAEGVSAVDLELKWTPVEGVSGYVVELENDELEVTLEASLPPSTPSLNVPNGFLLAGTEYDLSIGTVTEEGNVSFVETSFRTAE